MGFDVREAAFAVGDDVVEPLHESLLRDDRQRIERRAIQPSMEPVIEGRSRHREPAKLRERTCLSVEQCLTGPMVV
jgi:hypothetical protein